MSKEQVGELKVGRSLRYKDSEAKAGVMVIGLPALYLQGGWSYPDIEECLNKIEPTTGLQNRILLARAMNTFLEDEIPEGFEVYLGAGGPEFSHFALMEGKPTVVVNKFHEELKMSMFEGMFGTTKLRFTAGTLINIFESIVQAEVYSETHST